jgi:DNA-directed RNA polymerase subunit RPC12/RpoP
MRNTTVSDKQSGRRDGLCPRCGTDAEWSFLDSEQTKVEVVCPDCGVFELSRAEFDQAEADIAGPGDIQ